MFLFVHCEYNKTVKLFPVSLLICCWLHQTSPKITVKTIVNLYKNKLAKINKSKLSKINIPLELQEYLKMCAAVFFFLKVKRHISKESGLTLEKNLMFHLLMYHCLINPPLFTELSSV